MKYRPELDGLRAVAVIPVVFYHAGFIGFSGGFVGVDVFFVISGYLIASIILNEKLEGRFSLINFYLRRTRRIFPALFIMMAVCYPIAFMALSPSGMKEFSASLIASTLFVGNLFFVGVSGYFDTAAELKPLLHTWSLSVEEQFYLIIPSLILLTWRFGRLFQASVLLTLAVFSLCWAQWQISQGYSANAFFFLHLRVWELLIGVLSAYINSYIVEGYRHNFRRFRSLAMLGILLILSAIFLYDKETSFPGVAALLPCIGAALVVLFIAPDSTTGKILSWQPIVFIGMISYSLYLWHYPIITFTKIFLGTDSTSAIIIGCVAALFFSWLSWKYVELPFRGRQSISKLKLCCYALLTIFILGGIGVLGEQTNGYRYFYLRYRMDLSTRLNYEKFMPHTSLSATTDETCQFDSEELVSEYELRFEGCKQKFGKGIVVVGDSHAGNIYRSLRSTGRYPFLVAFWKGGCRPFKARTKCLYEEFPAFLERHKKYFSNVVFHISGSHLIRDYLDRADSNASFVIGSHTRIALEDINATINYLEQLRVGPNVIWLGPFAEARVNLRDPENFNPARLRFNPVSIDLFNKLDNVLKAETSKEDKFTYASLIDALRFDGDALIIDGCLTFADTDHLSRCGEDLFGTFIAKAISHNK